jgi:hypothetical protein
MKTILPLTAALAFSAAMFAATAASAAPHEIVLATPAEAKSMCQKLGEWDIAAIIGPPGFAQFGPGYKCKQEVSTNSGLGNAIEAGKGECVLASAAEAKTVCNSMGAWDIAIIQGPAGMSQFGPSYGCKQEVPKGTGVGNAICK